MNGRQSTFVVFQSACAAGLLLLCSACATPVNPALLRKAETHRSLADLKLQKGHLPFAIREYRASISINAESAEAHFGLGEAYRRKAMLDAAEKEFLEAIRIDPTHQDAQLNLGVVYMQSERWGQAIEINTHLIDSHVFLAPQRALVNRGWAFYKSGDLAGAEIDFREVLGSYGSDPRAHLNLGIVLYDRGETLEAMGHFESAASASSNAQQIVMPIETHARFLLAQAHVKLGQRDKAIAQFRAASEGGNSEWARKSREYLSVLE